MLCGIAFGYIRNHAVVEEIVNDVFVRYWNNRSTIIIRASIKDYLFTSVKNACIDYLRTAKKHSRTTLYIDDQSIVCNTLAELGENPLEYLITNETEQQILKAIDELPERYRLTFILNRLDEMSYNEVAKTMGITKNTVKSNLRDALALLREKLKDLVLIATFLISQ